MFKELSDVCEFTGFAGMCLQPNSGAQGEYAGLNGHSGLPRVKRVITAQKHTDLIPASAHGTNPASAVMAGFKVVVTSCDENGT